MEPPDGSYEWFDTAEEEREVAQTVKHIHEITETQLRRAFREHVLGPDIREDVCFIFQNYFRAKFARNQDFLREQQINRHGYDHQRHVVAIANSIARAFRPDGADETDELSDDRLRAALIFGLIHDAGYEPAAHPKANGEPTVTKKTLDYHPVRGARIAQHLLDYFDMDEELRAMDFCPMPELEELPPPAVIDRAQKVTRNWTPEQKRIAIESILFHSNGSEYDGDVSLSAKLIRLADKLDMHNRVVTEHITPDVRDRDPMYFHRLVPSSIKDMDIKVNHHDGSFQVDYHVEIEDLAHDLNGGYTNEQFVADFRSAYDKSMGIAAEVVKSLREYRTGSELPEDADYLRVNLILWKNRGANQSDFETVVLDYAPYTQTKSQKNETAA